jgi:hypothetical protein
LPFAEAEKQFRLLLANFGGEERRIGRTRCVLKEQRAKGDRVVGCKIQTGTVGDSIEIGDTRSAGRAGSRLHCNGSALGNGEIGWGIYDTEGRRSRCLRRGGKTGPAESNGVGSGGSDGSSGGSSKGCDDVNCDGLAEMDCRGTCLAEEILENTAELALDREALGVN